MLVQRSSLLCYRVFLQTLLLLPCFPATPFLNLSHFELCVRAFYKVNDLLFSIMWPCLGLEIGKGSKEDIAVSWEERGKVAFSPISINAGSFQQTSWANGEYQWGGGAVLGREPITLIRMDKLTDSLQRRKPWIAKRSWCLFHLGSFRPSSLLGTLIFQSLCLESDEIATQRESIVFNQLSDSWTCSVKVTLSWEKHGSCPCLPSLISFFVYLWVRD